MKKKAKVRRIVISVFEEENRVSVSFVPRLSSKEQDNVSKHVNTLVNGFSLGLQTLMRNELMLRPATPEEIEAKVYVFKDVEKDNKLYDARKHLFNQFTDALSSIIAELFPDVLYVNRSIEYQQNLVTEMTPEEAKAHQEKVQKIVDLIKSVKDVAQQGDNDGDNYPL